MKTKPPGKIMFEPLLIFQGCFSRTSRFQNSLGDRWGVRGSIGLGILAVTVQVVVFRVILVENLPPKVKQSIDEPYEPWNLEVFFMGI